MAEPKPKTESAKPESATAPSLAAVPDPQAPAPQAQEASSGRGGASWWLVALLALLLVGSLWGLVGQTRHANAQAVEIAELSGQVGELQARLTELSSQLAGFGMQRELVNVSVDKLLGQLTQLQALVRWDPSKPGAAAEGGEAAPQQPSTGQTGSAPAPAESSAEPSTQPSGASTPPSGGIDLDSVPALKPGPSLQLAPRDQV